jgi:hypothetical protein
MTVFVPTGKKLPEGGVQTTGTLPSQLSTAVTVKVATLPLAPLQFSTMLGQGVKTGARESTTATYCVQIVLELVQQSVTSQRPAQTFRQGAETTRLLSISE